MSSNPSRLAFRQREQPIPVPVNLISATRRNGSSARDECGVAAVIGPNAGSLTYKLLKEQQSRGQESAGLAWPSADGISMERGPGRVREAVNIKNLPSGSGIAIGQVRYSTSGGRKDSGLDEALETERLMSEAQPMQVGDVAVGFNGNLSNFEFLRTLVSPLITSTDTEVLPRYINERKAAGMTTVGAVSSLLAEIDGACSMVVLDGNTVVAARDHNGYKPLVIGRIGDNIVVASESAGITKLAGKVMHDVAPGEIVTIDANQIMTVHSPLVYNKRTKTTCLMEVIYLSKDKTVIDGVNVGDARLAIGRSVGRHHDGVEADIVVPIPKTAVRFARGYASVTGIPIAKGLVLLDHEGRSFIAPNDDVRIDIAKGKLAVDKDVVEGKRIVLFDDSVVRGNTLGVVIAALREAGAREVHVRIGSPPILWPCFMGVDYPTSAELLARNATPKEMARMLGADSLEYARLEEVIEAIGRKDFCTACFNGEYPLRKDTLGMNGVIALSRD